MVGGEAEGGREGEGGTFAECRGGGNVPMRGEGGQRNFNRRDITGGNAAGGIRGSNFLKERASRCKFALQLLALLGY